MPVIRVTAERAALAVVLREVAAAAGCVLMGRRRGSQEHGLRQPRRTLCCQLRRLRGLVSDASLLQHLTETQHCRIGMPGCCSCCASHTVLYSIICSSGALLRAGKRPDDMPFYKTVSDAGVCTHAEGC